MPRPFNAREFLGYSGALLPRPDGGNLPAAVRERFKRTGNEAFIPFIDPWATIAQADQYRRAQQDMAIADAELGFLEGLDENANNPAGIRGFLQANPKAIYSPMVRAYQAAVAQPKDPFEAKVAGEGAQHLTDYRKRLQEGQSPMDSFAQFRDVIKAEEEKAKTKPATEDEELWFVEKGGSLEDYGVLKKQGASKGQMLEAIQQKGKPITTTEGKKLNELQSNIEAAVGLMTYDNEDDYEKDIIAAYGKKPETEQEWQEAYFKLKEKKVGPAKKAYDDYIEVLLEQNKRIPGLTKPAPPNGLPAAPAPSTFDGGTPATVPAPKKAGTSPLSQVRQALKP